jgi:hypothetical protein
VEHTGKVFVWGGLENGSDSPTELVVLNTGDDASRERREGGKERRRKGKEERLEDLKWRGRFFFLFLESKRGNAGVCSFLLPLTVECI